MDGAGKGGVGPEPAARGQVVNLPARAKLAVGQVGFWCLQAHEIHSIGLRLSAILCQWVSYSRRKQISISSFLHIMVRQ